jgi:TPR repeat protein
MKAAILVLLLFSSALADGPAGLQAIKNGDYVTAFRELFPLAQAGDSRAQIYIAWFYGDGLGVQRNDEESVTWYRAAAEQGQVAAQVILGITYEKGEKSVQVDHKEAAKWYRLAAEQGNGNAQYFLGYMYSEGPGVPQDYIKAHMWLNLAGANGTAGSIRTTSINLRDLIAGRMTPGQIEEAQRRA